MLNKKTSYSESPAVLGSEAPELSARIPQQAVRIKQLPRPFQWEYSSSENGVAIITDDYSPLTPLLAKALMARGFRVVILSLGGVSCEQPENAVLLSLQETNEEAVRELIQQVQAHGSPALFIYLHPWGKPSWGKPEKDTVQLVFWLAKHLQPIFQNQTGKRCSFLCCIRLNGAFGYSATTDFDWQVGGLSGLVKSLNREWPCVFCRSLDLHPALNPEQAVEYLLTELQDIDLALTEVGYNAALSRQTPTTETIEVSQNSMSPPAFAPRDVVLVTGGAQGITAQCIIALARTCRCTFLLLGRSKWEEEEPVWAEGMSEEKALKRSIFKYLQNAGKKPSPLFVQEMYQQLCSSRNIKKTLQAIRNSGAKAVYVQADITEAAATQEVLATLQQRWGTITGLIHGAGVIADKRLEKKTALDFARVYGTKVEGLQHVLHVLDSSSLKNIVLFSSIAGFYGNEGQTDYALANEALNKWALSYQHQHPETKVLAINWGPWNTGMITPFIQQKFQKRGVSLIQQEEGVEHFLALLTGEKAQGVVLVNQHMPAPEKKLLVSGQLLRIKKQVKRKENPFLEHHIIGDFPVMPFVTGIAWMTNAAEQLFPHFALVQCKNSKLFNGIVFNGQQAEDYYLDLQVLEQDKESVYLSAKVWSLDQQDRRRYHYGSDIVLSSLPAEQPVRALPCFQKPPLKTREALYKEGSLFHGPAFQGMEALWQMDEKELWYSCSLPVPDPTIEGQFPLQTSNTFATDAMCQGFLVWAFHQLNTSCLPSALGSLRIYEPLPFRESFWVQLSITQQQGHKIMGNATAISAAGRVLAEARDVALTISQELLALYPKPTDALAIVGMDIQLPGIPHLNAFHAALYDGTLSAKMQEVALPSPTASSGLQLLLDSAAGKPLAVVRVGDHKELSGKALQAKELLTLTTLSEALPAAEKWLQQHPEGSILLVAQDPILQSEAIVRLMLSSQASKTQQPVYAVLNSPQPFIPAKLEALLSALNYLDTDTTIPPPNFSPTYKAATEFPSCALGTFVLTHTALQDLARLIKLSLCIHYGFIPALTESHRMPHLGEWDAQHFYAPQNSFPWIPENREEKKIGALVCKGTEGPLLLKLEEAASPAKKSRAYLRQQERKLVLVSANDLAGLMEGLDTLEKEAGTFSHQWAEALYQRHQAQAGKYTLSLVAANQSQLLREINYASKGVERAFEQRKTWQTPNGSYFTAEPLGKKAKIAFVYPGLASSYGGMIKDIFQLFPNYLEHYRTKVAQLHRLVHLPLVHPRYLQAPHAAEREAREAEFMRDTVAAAESSVSLSVFTTQVLRKAFNLQPAAALGYSLGGISMFFSMEVWGFQHLSSRVRESKLFQHKKDFQHWAHWVVKAPAEEVKQLLAPSEKLHLSFINSPRSVVLSGERSAGEAWLRHHQYEGIGIYLYHVAHCPPVVPMHENLRQMHLMEIEKEPPVQFYSSHHKEGIPLNEESLAQHVADTYCRPVDFVSQVRNAYRDGMNVFIEVGPKAWCSRLVDDILQDEPHLSLATNQKGISDYRSLLHMSSMLCSHGIPIQLPFYEAANANLLSVPASPENIHPTIHAGLSTSGSAPSARLSDLCFLCPSLQTGSRRFFQSDHIEVSATLLKSEDFTDSSTSLKTCARAAAKKQEGFVRLEEGISLLQSLKEACYVYQDRESNYFLSASSSPHSQYKIAGYLPALPPQKLGSAAFKEAHKLKYAYMAGAMANGIASEELVIALGQQGLLGSFGAAGLRLERVEKAIHKIQKALPQGPYAFNLIHSPAEQALEVQLVELYLRYKVRTLEASAFMEISPALVYYRAAGLRKADGGEIVAQNKIIAKVSRPEVARLFMQPAPEALLKVLLMQGKISPEQMEWAKSIPLADDVTVEADSGGHTDQQALVCILPEIIRLKEGIENLYSYAEPLRIGAAGGISTPTAVVGAFALGADYVVTGSINQACVEAATSPQVKVLLAKASLADVVLAPSADMFEMGISVQVLKWGTLYANRAKKLYHLYSQHESLADIPAKEMEKLEKQLFQQPVSAVWREVVQYFQENDPAKLEAAREHPKKKMALVFRWYLGLSSKWAVKGTRERVMDYQVWCGPAMGAFNDWVKGSPMEALEKRKVAAVAMRLLREASLLQRLQLLKMFGVPDAVANRAFQQDKVMDYV